MMGAERRSMIMTEEEKLATAYHETGHALVNILMPGNDPLHKVTIIPRGRALGVTMSLPERDKLTYSKQWCEARVATMFGGRVAEQLIYGEEHLNTGASSDIMQATELARRMVTEWGMSEKLGPLRYNDNQQEVFLGHAITQRQNMSEETAQADRRGGSPHRHRRREEGARGALRQPRQARADHPGVDGVRDHHRRGGERPDARREDRARDATTRTPRARPALPFLLPASRVRRAPSPAPAASSPTRRRKSFASDRASGRQGDSSCPFHRTPRTPHGPSVSHGAPACVLGSRPR